MTRFKKKIRLRLEQLEPRNLLASLVAAYAFNEGSGNTVADYSGNGNDGTISGATWTTGKYDSALSFDGVSSVVTIKDSPFVDLTKSMTLEAWVQPSVAASGYSAIIA